MSSLSFWLLCLMLVVKITYHATDNEFPWPLSLLETLLSFLFLAPLIYDWLRARHDSQDRALFLLELSDLLTMGVPAQEAVEKLSQCRSRQFTHRFSQFARDLALVNERSQAGESLDAAFLSVSSMPRSWGAYLHLCRTPQETATLCRQLAEVEMSRLRLPVLSLLRYYLLLPLLLGVSFFLSIYIMPTFVELFKGMEVSLPPLTRVFLYVSDLLRMVGILPLLLMLGIFFVSLAIPFLAVRRLLRLGMSYLPVGKGLAKLDGQRRVYGVIGTGLKHGADESACLNAALDASWHPWYRKFLLSALEQHSAGDSLAARMAQADHLFSPSLVGLVKQGEAIENLPDALIVAAELANSELEHESRKAVTRLDTLLLVVTGVCVGAICIAVLQPIYQMIGSFGP